LALRRNRGLIGVDPVQFQEEVPQGQHLPDVHEQQVRLRIEFGKGGCLGVYADGKKLELLSADHVNAGFAEADYRGPWGLYHEGGSGNQMPTWFGDVGFTPLMEK